MQSTNPAPLRDPTAQQPQGGAAPTPAPESTNEAWKIAALAFALMVVVAVVYVLSVGTSTDESAKAKPKEKAQVAKKEEAKEKKRPAPPPLPPIAASSPSSFHSSGTPEGAVPLPPVEVLSVGYSPLRSRRVATLRIGGGLPYFVHEGETVGDITIVAILSNSIQISRAGKTYDLDMGK